jgi:hypothetical protein
MANKSVAGEKRNNSECSITVPGPGGGGTKELSPGGQSFILNGQEVGYTFLAEIQKQINQRTKADYMDL